MEFLPGAFESEWERRRAAVLHELQMGQRAKLDWELPRRGGRARIWGEGPGLRGSRRRPADRGRASLGGDGLGRSMRSRFEALARGSQPAVVKLASYGGGVRAAAMMSYASRNGELPMEAETGQRLAGKAALASLRSEWEHLFDNRAASRDIGMFQVTIAGTSLAGNQEQDEAVREILRAGFGGRRFVYTVHERAADELPVGGVLVLREGKGERLTGDSKAASIVQQRFDESEIGRDVRARFRFHGYGNGVEFATARVRDLVERGNGAVRDETGRPIDSLEQSCNLVQKEWRRQLHSRKGRDVMHLIVSARAGTDAAAFQAAVRDFLGGRFAGHRYVFAIHDPSEDPREMGEGGKRPHIHAHAIVTMRSETGERIETSPRVFREWRSLMAEKAREHGVDMELTDRRDLASPPAYTRNQVRPVSYFGRTEHEGTSAAAQARYDAKRTNRLQVTGSSRSAKYAAEATEVWRGVALVGRETAIGDFAAGQLERIETGLRQSQINIEKWLRDRNATNYNSNMIALGEPVASDEAPMRAMTRPEFDSYERRVEAVLASVETSLEPWERKGFEEIAAAAREVVDIRREYLELMEQQADAAGRRGGRAADDSRRAENNVAGHGRQEVELGNKVLRDMETARRLIDRANQEGRDPAPLPAEFDRQLERAARLAVAGNSCVRETSASDRDVQMAIEPMERIHAPGRAPEGRSVETGGAGQDEQSANISRDAELPTRWERARTAQSADRNPPRSDPPQQHVPHIQEQEYKTEHKRERDRHDRER